MSPPLNLIQEFLCSAINLIAHLFRANGRKAEKLFENTLIQELVARVLPQRLIVEGLHQYRALVSATQPLSPTSDSCQGFSRQGETPSPDRNFESLNAFRPA
jgi:hypothetical protein